MFVNNYMQNVTINSVFYGIEHFWIFSGSKADVWTVCRVSQIWIKIIDTTFTYHGLCNWHISADILSPANYFEIIILINYWSSIIINFWYKSKTTFWYYYNSILFINRVQCWTCGWTNSLVLLEQIVLLN